MLAWSQLAIHLHRYDVRFVFSKCAHAMLAWSQLSIHLHRNDVRLFYFLSVPTPLFVLPCTHKCILS